MQCTLHLPAHCYTRTGESGATAAEDEAISEEEAAARRAERELQEKLKDPAYTGGLNKRPYIQTGRQGGRG
jgi:hypothetical protein